MRGKDIDKKLSNSTWIETSKRKEAKDETALTIWFAMLLIMFALMAIL